MQMEQAMVDPALQDELKPGEQLLWWGRPDPRRRAKTAGTQSISYIIYGVMVIVMAVLVASSIQLAQEETSYLSGPSTSTIALLIAAIILLGAYAYRIFLLYSQRAKYSITLKNTIYGITNQRVIVMTANPRGFAVNSYTHNDIGQINRVETGDGWGDVSYGKVRQMRSGLRTLNVTEKLVGIPNARMVADILARTFKNAGPGAPWYPPQTPALMLQYPPLPQEYVQPPQN